MCSPRRAAGLALLLAVFAVLLTVVQTRRSVEVWHVVPDQTAGQDDEGP